MKENIENDEKMMPFRVHDNRRSDSGKLSNYAIVIGCGDSDPPTSDLLSLIPTLVTRSVTTGRKERDITTKECYFGTLSW